MNRLYLLPVITLATGCVSTPYSDERLKAVTANILGIQPNQIIISDKRTSGTTTYYSAKVRSTEYACEESGGSVMTSVMNMGVSSPPKCQNISKNPKADPESPHPPT